MKWKWIYLKRNQQKKIVWRINTLKDVLNIESYNGLRHIHYYLRYDLHSNNGNSHSKILRLLKCVNVYELAHCLISTSVNVQSFDVDLH